MTERSARWRQKPPTGANPGHCPGGGGGGFITGSSLHLQRQAPRLQPHVERSVIQRISDGPRGSYDAFAEGERREARPLLHRPPAVKQHPELRWS